MMYLHLMDFALVSSTYLPEFLNKDIGNTRPLARPLELAKR